MTLTRFEFLAFLVAFLFVGGIIGALCHRDLAGTEEIRQPWMESPPLTRNGLCIEVCGVPDGSYGAPIHLSCEPGSGMQP